MIYEKNFKIATLNTSKSSVLRFGKIIMNWGVFFLKTDCDHYLFNIMQFCNAVFCNMDE